MTLGEAYNRSQISQALVDSVQSNTLGYGNLGNYNFNLANWRNAESLNASMGNSVQRRTWDAITSPLRGQTRNFTVVQEKFNRELLAASQAYLNGNKEAAIGQFEAMGVTIDSKKDNTAQVREIVNGIQLAQNQPHTIKDRNENYAKMQQAYTQELQRISQENKNNGLTVVEGENDQPSVLQRDGVVYAQASRQYQALTQEALPSDKRGYLAKKIAELQEQGVDVTKYNEIFARDREFDNDGSKAFARVTSHAQGELSSTISKLRGNLDEMEVMNRALKGDPLFADVLKQMRAVQVLGGYTDQTAEGIQARVNNSFINNGFAFKTKENQVAVLATGDQQVEDAKEVKGTTIRAGQEKVVEQLKDGVIVEIDGKQYRKTSSYDSSTKLRTTYVQEWNKDSKAVEGAETAYFQKRSEDGKKRGELVKVTLGGEADAQEKALKKAKEVALDKKKTLKEVGSAKHDYQPSNSQGGTMPTKEGFNWGTVAASAGAGAATGAAIGGPPGAVIGTVVGGTVGLVAAATGDKNQVKRSTPVPKYSSASASAPATPTPAVPATPAAKA
jgi:co-chaperonin GroES (HSP10)